MKKMLAIVAVATAFTITSCGGGGFEADARKSAEMRCKMQKLEAAAKADSTKMKDLEAFQKEAMAFGKEMMEKYKDKKEDKAMDEKAEKIMNEVMEKCK